MKWKEACGLLVFAVAHVYVTYSAYTSIGWELVREFYIPVSLATFFQLYVVVDVVKNKSAALKNWWNLVFFLAAMGLYYGVFFVHML